MRVLMVCLGNICRSPLAEGILDHKIKLHQLDWTVDSAGTSGWHEGEKPDTRSIDVAIQHQIDISKQKSRKYTVDDFDNFDLILAMDSSNYQDIIKLARNESDKNKVKLILNYSYPNSNKAVPDPYYEGGFEYVYTEIEKAIEHLIKDIIK